MRNLLPKILFLCILSLISRTAYAYGCEVDGIYYNLSGDEASVTYQKYEEGVYYSPYTGSIIIPSTITYNGKTYDVTSIGSSAFYRCSGLTSVIIGNSVTSIGNSAFEGCSGLTSVIIGNSVTSIGNSAFYRCSGLTAVIIGNSVTSIGSSAFEGCSGLTSVTIPSSVTSISTSAFPGCSGLTAVTVESGNTVYDSRNNCNAIIETASNTLIAGCQNTVIPNSVTNIGARAFNGCSGLTAVNIPNSVTSIGGRAFDGCSGLTAVNIPNSVTSIGNHAFGDCSGLTAVNISNSMTSIEYGAFDGCSGLTSITIPNSVTSIGDFAFHGCSGLTAVTIPNSVTSIGSSAFGSCSDLTTVTIGNGVTSIGFVAFGGCNILRDVYCYAENVPEASFSFPLKSSTVTITLHVPEALYESYKTTAPWSGFGLIVPIVKYHLTYVVDGVEYKSFEIEEGTAIVPEENPIKENYTFSGWSEIPATMPAHDITVTGSFTCDLPQCATPTVTLLGNGQIEVECATEGAKCVTTVTTTSEMEETEFNLSDAVTTYHISAYATAEGYEDSEVVTTSFKWSKKNGDLNGDNLVNISDVTTLVNIILGK